MSRGKAKPKRSPEERIARQNEQKRQWRRRNSEMMREYIRRYRAKHRERIRAYRRRHYAKNREHIREYRRQYQAKNRERIAALKRARRIASGALGLRLPMHTEFDQWRHRGKEWMAEVGRRVRAARGRAGLTQTALAKAGGLFQTQISRIEHGRISASRRTLQRIVDVLGVPLGRLIPARLPPSSR
jgi:ribosome-binding protein aMBF1 (putative translation factor)